MNLHIDLYGRGYSDAPLTTYDSALYATQLALLMQHVKWDKAAITGISMVNFMCTIEKISLFDTVPRAVESLPHSMRIFLTLLMARWHSSRPLVS